MFIGHAAVGFAAKRWAPRASLAWLLAAPWLLDFLWPVSLLLGAERVRPRPDAVSPFLNLEFVAYPWSHSLLMALAWAALFGVLYARATRDRRGAWILAALVVSHWLLDFLVHVPDLPLVPGPSPRVGLGLWRFPAYTMFVEGVMFVGGLAVYVGCTRPRDAWGNVGLAGLVATLLGIYWLSLSGGAPPGAAAIAWTMLAFGAVVVPWAAWIERHRRPAGDEDQSRML
jgi:hypothetical protein